jgi:ADP-ribose pyrophosphatase
MNAGSVERVASRTVFTGRIFAVTLDRVRLGPDREVELEIVRHPRSVVLIPMPDVHHVVLVRQYRYAIDRWIWELPAGSVEAGEEVEAAARRECLEEIGRVPRRLERLAAFFPTPGYCDEEMTFFRLDGLEMPETPGVPDEDERIEPRLFTVQEARDLVARGEIVDMKTAVGLALIA